MMKSISFILFAVCLTLVGVLSSSWFNQGEVTGAGQIASRNVASKVSTQASLDSRVQNLISFSASKYLKNHEEEFVAAKATY